MKSEMVEKLREYFRNTDKAQLIAEWTKIEQMQLEGPNAFEYIQYYSNFYKVKVKDYLFEEVTFPKNINPEFSGFFFVISQHERGKKGCLYI